LAVDVAVANSWDADIVSEKARMRRMQTMTQPVRPTIQFLSDETVRDVVAEAKRILDEIGVFVEHQRAIDLLAGAGGRVDGDRVHINPGMVDNALETTPSEVFLFDRNGENPVHIGGQSVNFDPGSAAIKVYDYDKAILRPSTTEDCALFSKLTDQLPAMALQSTCVVPNDVPRERADRVRLNIVLRNGLKAVITGTFEGDSFELMRRMLVCVRGSEAALREKPLAIFDCCPSPPLEWSELTCSALVQCAEQGIPAEMVSMPLTGATSPVTLLGAITQHAAECLSGIVIHQLAKAGSPIIWGGSPAAFDMRQGTTPMGAIETMMIDASYAQVGKVLNVPTHAYMGMSDAKTADYQSGLETGYGAIMAALAGVNMVSGPGMLDFESTQSLEKLVLDNEACGMALRAIRGIERRDEVMALDVLREGIQAEQFLKLSHTRKWYRQEYYFPGPVIDRTVGDMWMIQGKKSAAERAHEQVEALLRKDGAPPLPDDVVKELDELMNAE
jgi:trimethylamine--corrinoid protein Co-methyltransferase